MHGRPGLPRAAHRGTVAGEIIAGLRQDIATGVLERGARLPSEQALAEQFGVSQPTIREAIRALDAMGLIDVRHGSGAYVRADPRFMVATSLQTLLQIERASVAEVLAVRDALGRESARQAALRATDEEIDAVEAIARDLEDVRGLQPQQIADCVAAFHLACATAARNTLLQGIQTFLVALLMQFRIGAEGRRAWLEWAAGSAAGRRRLVDALRERDPDAAQRAMEACLSDERGAIASDPELAEVRLSDPEALDTLSDVVQRLRSTQP